MSQSFPLYPSLMFVISIIEKNTFLIKQQSYDIYGTLARK